MKRIVLIALAAVILAGAAWFTEPWWESNAKRTERVRRIFVETLGRDPKGWDEASLRYWVDSRLRPSQIRRQLESQRPLVGVHYFTWYRRTEGSPWGNGMTTVLPDSAKPELGWYNSNDREVMDAHIAQMASAGFDFVIVNIIADSPPSWGNAQKFFDRLAGHRLRAAVMIDGLNVAPAAVKQQWVEKAKTGLAMHPNYFALHGQPLIMLYSAPLDFQVDGVALRNVYWTSDYAPAANSFNPDHALHPRDWPFWSPHAPAVINGVVPVMPGYSDSHLGRAVSMEHPRRDGSLYHEQWQRALALRPELIIVYGWNEYFEQTFIEPTDRFGDRYVKWTACYAALAHAGQRGTC